MEQVTEQYFDPFAEPGEEVMDFAAAHARRVELYVNNQVEHDYSADKFVAETEALVLTAQYQGMFEQAAEIEMTMHLLCVLEGPGGHLQSVMAVSPVFGGMELQEQSTVSGMPGKTKTDKRAKTPSRPAPSRRPARAKWPGLANKLIQLCYPKS